MKAVSIGVYVYLNQIYEKFMRVEDDVDVSNARDLFSISMRRLRGVEIQSIESRTTPIGTFSSFSIQFKLYFKRIACSRRTDTRLPSVISKVKVPRPFHDCTLFPLLTVVFFPRA